MSEDKNGNKSTNMLNNLIKDGVKKFSDGLQNIANNMDHPFTGKFPDAPSTSSNNSVPTGLITFDLGITIQEVTTGCIKKLKISRKVFSADGSFYTEDSILEVPIKKGLRAGSRITFPNAGDRYPQKKADDLVVIIYDKPNQQYIRDKDDVTYRCNLSISDALCGCILHIPLILGGTYQMTITDVCEFVVIRDDVSEVSRWERNISSPMGREDQRYKINAMLSKRSLSLFLMTYLLSKKKWIVPSLKTDDGGYETKMSAFMRFSNK